MSGLFDTGITGEAGFSSVGNQAGFDDLKTLNSSDIFSVMEKGGDLSALDTLPDLHALADEDNFFEEFTDLSNFLLTGNDANFPLTPEVRADMDTVVPLPKVARQATKRTATEAFGDVAVVPVTPNPDHNDYISKEKRPRVSTSSIEESESEATPLTKDEKYLERRRKNNIASRRSRQTRKQKFTDMEQQAMDLEDSNVALQQKVVELEKLTKMMKDILVKKLAGGK